MTKVDPAWPLGRFPMALGTMALTGTYGRVEPSVALATIRKAIDLGFDHFDTAELYGPYASEELLARALAGRRKVTVATKVGYRLRDGKPVGLDSRPRSLRSAVEGSLKRLGRDCVDLVYQHRQDPDVPVEEAVGCLSDLVREGKVRFVGLSRIDAVTLARAGAVHPIAAIQNEVSLLAGPLDPSLLSLASTSGAAPLGYSLLARGLLAGRSTTPGPGDHRSNNPQFTSEALGRLQAALAPLRDIGAALGTSSTGIALAWVRAMGAIPIVGPKTPAQLDDAASAVSINLSPDVMALLNSIVPGNGFPSDRGRDRAQSAG